jgi:hypothetical protein
MIKYDEPIYDPFGERGPTFYHPANEAAEHLIAIQLIYRDIEKLSNMYKESKDSYTKRLLAKYMIIEILSIDSHIISLANKIISGQTGYEIEPNALTKAKELYKQYKNIRKKKWHELKTIRDKLAAHRDQLNLITISKLWDNIDIKAISEIVNSIPPFFNFLKNLNVYCWTKTGQDEKGNEIIAIIQPLEYSKIKFVEDKHGA